MKLIFDKKIENLRKKIEDERKIYEEKERKIKEDIMKSLIEEHMKYLGIDVVLKKNSDENVEKISENSNNLFENNERKEENE